MMSMKAERWGPAICRGEGSDHLTIRVRGPLGGGSFVTLSACSSCSTAPGCEIHSGSVLATASPWRIRSMRRLTLVVMVFAAACGPSAAELAQVTYAPAPVGDWEISTPEAEGLDPLRMAELYWHAEGVETLYALLVVKNGKLVGEKYFNGGSLDGTSNLQSATKSVLSALVGLAIHDGCMPGLDTRMMDFFPELEDRIRDPRKRQITVRQMLQMRAGYPWEESDRQLFDLLYSGLRPRHLVDVPLEYDPGTDNRYSNLTSHLLGVALARACETDLLTFGQERLFSPMDVTIAGWLPSWEGYYLGLGGLQITARDMAKFGQLYLDRGVFKGERLLPEAWVEESFQIYSPNAWRIGIGDNVGNLGYGYQWWSVESGPYRYHMAWGHGGQQIVILDDANLVVVVKADPLEGDHGGGPWGKEKANLNLVGNFIASLANR